MEIISVRKGFASDHSSTSYEFLAVVRKTGKNVIAEFAGMLDYI